MATNQRRMELIRAWYPYARIMYACHLNNDNAGYNSAWVEFNKWCAAQEPSFTHEEITDVAEVQISPVDTDRRIQVLTRNLIDQLQKAGQTTDGLHRAVQTFRVWAHKWALPAEYDDVVRDIFGRLKLPVPALNSLPEPGALTPTTAPTSPMPAIATPESRDIVVRSPSVPVATKKAPPKGLTTSALANPEPEVILPKVKSEKLDTSPTSLHGRGEIIENIYDLHEVKGLKVIPEKSHRALRHDVFWVQLPRGMKFSALEGCAREVTSALGLKPLEYGITIIPQENNQVKIQVPLPPDQWQPVYYFSGVGDREARQLVQESFEDFLAYIRKFWGVNPWDDLRVPFMMDVDTSEPFLINLTRHLLMSGASGTGKSNSLHVIVLGLLLLYCPEWLQIVCVDFHNGATLKPYKGLRGIYKGKIYTTCDEFNDLFIELQSEFRKRLKIISPDEGACYDDIRDYNRGNPDNPIPWMVVILEEWTIFALAYPDESVAMLTEMLGSWRKCGIVVIGIGQYTTEKAGFPRQARSNFDTRACGHMKSGAEYVLGEETPKDVLRLAGKLLVGGDFLVLQDGRVHRGQVFAVKDRSKVLPDGRILDYVAETVAALKRVEGLRVIEGGDQPVLLGGVRGEPIPKSLPGAATTGPAKPGRLRQAIITALEGDRNRKISQIQILRLLNPGQPVDSGQPWRDAKRILAELLVREFKTNRLGDAVEQVRQEVVDGDDSGEVVDAQIC